MVMGDGEVAVLEQTPERALPPGRRGWGAAIAVASALAVLTAGLGYIDGTGLFAPENWLDAGFVPTYATSPAWATLLFLPLLIGGSALVCHRVLGELAPGSPMRWAYWGAWSSVVLAAIAAKLIFTLFLLGVAGPAALSVRPTVGGVLAQSGLAGAKYAVVGLLAAAPAAVVYRLRRPRTDTVPAAGAPVFLWSPLWFLAGALIAAKATGSTSAWMGGPGHRVVLPIAGFAGAYLLARLVWARIARRLSASRAKHCFARASTTTGTSAVGFLLPWLIDGVVNGFGGGLFPVVAALAHLGAGVLAGALTAAFGSLWSLVRPRARRFVAPLVGSPRRRYVTVGLALVAAVGLQFVPLSAPAAPPAVPSAPSSDGAGLLALTVRRDDTPTIVDSAGRQVLLRGVNVNQLVDYGQRDPAAPTVRPLAEDDYARMAEVYGFNVARLSLSWSAVEPQRGVFDRGYLARVRAAVDQAARHGIYTVLDMHQDTYSKYVTATPGTTCRLLAEPEFGNDGAPEWATLTGGAPGCGFMGRDLSPNVQQAFTNLYADTDGIGTEFACMWGVLASEFAGDTAVAGYDLLNEPGPGNAPGVTSSALLGRLYRQAITSIREAESRTAGGFPHLVFFEPSILWSGLGFDVSPPVGFSDDPGLVFSPHLYNESITMDQGLGVTLSTIEQGYTMARRAADAYGVPLWSGEWGWFGDITQVTDRYYRFLSQQNENLLGSAVWVWKKACGDPQTGAGDATSGGLNLLACPSGTELAGPAFLTPALAQAYPRAAPGRLTSLSSSPTTVDMRLTGRGSGTLDVWIPGPAAPAVTGEGLADRQLGPQPGGGWRLTARTSGAYSLALRSS